MPHTHVYHIHVYVCKLETIKHVPAIAEYIQTLGMVRLLNIQWTSVQFKVHIKLCADFFYLSFYLNTEHCHYMWHKSSN